MTTVFWNMRPCSLAHWYLLTKLHDDVSMSPKYPKKPNHLLYSHMYDSVMNFNELRQMMSLCTEINIVDCILRKL